MRVMRRSLLALAALAVSAFMSPAAAGDEQLCAVTPGSYAAAKAAHPEMAFAIAEVEQHGIATWYTDRGGNAAGTAKAIVSSCPSSSRLAIVVYGLPNKDCEARESMGGSNTNNAQYQSFVSTLQQTVGDRKVLYVLEPDAIALLAGGGCAKSYGYDASLAIAVRTLSQNPNADIYLDVGHWILGDSGKLGTVASIVRSLASNGRIKGVSINTSNYRSNAELSGLCANFRSATAGLNLHCIIDTSRNYNGPSTQSEWCNYKNAGIGKVPTGSTGDPNIDYYVWIKPPGESDGVCSSGHTGDAMVGPGAGAFFPAFFKSLWNEGALVKEKGMPKIDGTIRAVQTSPTPTPTPEVTTPTPTTPTPTNATTTQTTNSTSSEDRSMDTPTATTTTTGSQVGAGVVSAPQEDSSSNPVFANAPTSETPSATEIQEANTQSKAGGSMSAGIVVFACLIGAAVVALVAVVAVRVRQRSIEETKTPMEPLEPRIHYLSNTPSGLSTL